MQLRWLRHVVLAGLATGLLAYAAGPEARAGSLTVDAGYDLWRTLAGTTFPGLGNLVGVPLGSYNFGSGPVGVGDTDTIIHRLDNVTVAAVGNTGTTRLEMVSLQLETAAPVDFGGAGLDNYFITLQSTRGGPATLGSMGITFGSLDGGSFTSFFDVFFDIRKGSLNGAIVFSNTDALRLTSDGADWNRIAPPGAVVINGVNHFLNGLNNDMDFWPLVGVVPPLKPLTERHPNGAVHIVTLADSGTTTPEPASWLMGATAVVFGLGYARRRRA